MSTNGLTSWAVDLKDIGAIYPFQGWEVLLVILGFAFWIGWHISRRARRARRLQPTWRLTAAATRPGQRSIATQQISSGHHERKAPAATRRRLSCQRLS